MHIFKVARALLIFFSCGYLTFIATIGLQTVLNGEIGVAVSAVTELNDVGFPLYTFCPEWMEPKHPFGLYEGRVTIEEVLEDRTDIRQFINVESTAGINGTWLKSFKLHTSVGPGGIKGDLNPCFTYYLPDAENVEDLAKEIIFKINMTSFGDLHLSIHDDGGYIDSHLNVYGREQVIFPTQMLGHAINRVVKIEIRNQEIEKADKTQCKDISDLDPFCLEKVIESQLGCKIPWSYSAISEDYVPCTGAAPLKKMVDLWPDGSMSSRSELVQILDKMQCFKSCVYNNYQPVKIYDKEFNEDINDQNEALLFLHIRLNNQGLERHAEFYIYDWGSFLSEIGGYLGLFLGYALISIIDFIENVWNSICKPQEATVQPGKSPRRSRRVSMTSRLSGSRKESMISLRPSVAFSRTRIDE